MHHRIKAVQTLEIALPKESGRAFTTIACTISSDGFINVYDVADIPDLEKSTAEEETLLTPKEINPLASYDSKGTRFTCLTLADGDVDISHVEGSKRKRDDDEDQNKDSENSEEEQEGEEESENKVEDERE